QAEDGIRGFHVTGVQTCALPIFALATMVAARAWGAFFVQAAAAAGVLGYLMKEPKQTLVVTMELLGWPLLYALMFRRRLTLPAQVGRASCRERVWISDAGVVLEE